MFLLRFFLIFTKEVLSIFVCFLDIGRVPSFIVGTAPKSSFLNFLASFSLIELFPLIIFSILQGENRFFPDKNSFAGCVLREILMST